MRSPDHEAASTRFAVDPDAVAAAASHLHRLADELASAIAGSRSPALGAVGAVPPSDLFNALAFSWGRWSRMLQDTEPALRSFGRAVGTSARGYATVETRLTAPTAAR
jgi:hypothetical protein